MRNGGEGGVFGSITFVAYSLNIFLRPPGLGLGIRNLICQALTDWEKGNCSRSIIDFLVANMIRTRNASDSKARRLEEIKLTTDVRCWDSRLTAI